VSKQGRRGRQHHNPAGIGVTAEEGCPTLVYVTRGARALVGGPARARVGIVRDHLRRPSRTIPSRYRVGDREIEVFATEDTPTDGLGLVLVYLAHEIPEIIAALDDTALDPTRLWRHPLFA